MERQGMNRREFLQVAGGVVAILPLAGFLAGCGGGGSSAPGPAAGDIVVTSSSVVGHTHSITIKAADLTAGAQVIYTSTNTNAHTHTVTITPAQFNDINEGRTDNIGSSVDLGHNHEFPVKK